MDQVKRTVRDVETESKKRIRDLDGHDLGDTVEDAGDEVKKKLGNLGDDVRRTAREVTHEVDKQTS